MKRLISVVLVLLLMLPTALAEGENTLLRHAVELGRELDAMTADEALLARRGVSGASRDVVDALGAGDRSAPCEVIVVDFTEIVEETLGQAADMSEPAKRRLVNVMPAALMNTMTAAYGVDVFIATSAIGAMKTFAAPDVSGQGLWIMYYEDALPVAVAWYAENGAVHMDGAILPDENFSFGELQLPIRTIAAARPALDEAANQLAAELQALARSGEYLSFIGLSDEVARMAQSYAAPEGTIPMQNLCTLTDAPDQAAVCLTQEIGMLGVTHLSAMSSLHHTLIFADETACGTGLYLFLYEDGAPIIVTWMGENGAYHLSAAFQPGEYPAFCRNADDANAWADSIGLNVRFQEPGAMLLP